MSLSRYVLVVALLSTLGIAAERAYQHAQIESVAQADPLDPNDCSRGIDEANQESCGGGQ